jgi:hypothetical protein
MHSSVDHQQPSSSEASSRWRRFVALFAGIFAGGLAIVYLFVLLVDPFDLVPFSLPIERRIVSINQRFMYPQIVRSKKFDSFVIGSSTSRLIDPKLLGTLFDARFVNLAMDSMYAWEQAQMMAYFVKHAGPPKVSIVGLDRVWCMAGKTIPLVTFRGFPEWLYDDNPWNDYLYLLNNQTAEIAGRLVGYNLGLYRERVRYDGFEVFVPPENAYDPARARQNLWHGKPNIIMPTKPPVVLSEAERQATIFPALQWLDEALVAMSSTPTKLLVYMPVHVTAQPTPGSRAAAIEAECKTRIDGIAARRGARVVDWRIASSLTNNDNNYWDPLHYRLPIGERVARETAAAVLGRGNGASPDRPFIVRR